MSSHLKLFIVIVCFIIYNVMCFDPIPFSFPISSSTRERAFQKAFYFKHTFELLRREYVCLFVFLATQMQLVSLEIWEMMRKRGSNAN